MAGGIFTVLAFSALAKHLWFWVSHTGLNYKELFLRQWYLLTMFFVCSFLALIIFRPTDEHN
jgi:hypothetical protein